MYRHTRGARAQVTLIFVYNANAGIVAGIMDSIHKTLSPATYPCSLCAITYGAVRMDPKWKAWLKAQPFESMFYHRPDFRAAYPGVTVDLPIVLIESDGTLTPLVNADEFANAPTVHALIALIETRLGYRGSIAPNCLPPKI
jgi:hypothetical protein